MRIVSSFDLRRGEVDRALISLLSGVEASELETRTLDFKEEVGSVTRAGGRGNGGSRNDAAAKDLAEASACLANTDGGAIVIGVDDKRGGAEALVGSALDGEWLRKRIWELSDPHLTVEVEEREEEGVRLLVIYVPRGFELHRVGRKMKHRIETGCVDMRPDDQVRVMEERSGYDWSAEATASTIDDVSPTALERARAFLRASGDRSREELATKEAPELLRRLGVLTASGKLNRAGELLF